MKDKRTSWGSRCDRLRKIQYPCFPESNNQKTSETQTEVDSIKSSAYIFKNCHERQRKSAILAQIKDTWLLTYIYDPGLDPIPEENVIKNVIGTTARTGIWMAG